MFEQFKAVAALSHCRLNPDLDDNQPIGLVAGDLPGIQRVLYTITAKGAAKTLRGHSAYLQLLSDALVRCVLQHFKLPWANVVFSQPKLAPLVDALSDGIQLVGNDADRFKNFTNFFEAVVAYHYAASEDRKKKRR